MLHPSLSLQTVQATQCSTVLSFHALLFSATCSCEANAQAWLHCHQIHAKWMLPAMHWLCTILYYTLPACTTDTRGHITLHCISHHKPYTVSSACTGLQGACRGESAVGCLLRARHGRTARCPHVPGECSPADQLQPAARQPTRPRGLPHHHHPQLPLQVLHTSPLTHPSTSPSRSWLCLLHCLFFLLMHWFCVSVLASKFLGS